MSNRRWMHKVVSYHVIFNNKRNGTQWMNLQKHYAKEKTTDKKGHIIYSSLT